MVRKALWIGFHMWDIPLLTILFFIYYVKKKDIFKIEIQLKLKYTLE